MMNWKRLVFSAILLVLADGYTVKNTLILGSGPIHRRCAASVSSSANFEASMEFTAPVIEVYSTPGCKYCRIAKAKLSELSLPYRNIDISIEEEDADKMDLTASQKERIAHAKSNTVPQIYVATERIGGCTELLAEVDSGSFAVRVGRYGIRPLVSKDENVNKAQASATPPLTDTSRFTPATGEPLNSLRFLRTTYPNTQINALDLSRRLQEQAAVVLDEFATPDGKKIDYARLLSSAEFAAYVELTCQLQHCSLAELGSLDHTEKIAFWGNLYNALIIHAKCVVRDETAAGLLLQSPEAIAARSAFYSGQTGAVYRVGGWTSGFAQSEAQADGLAGMDTCAEEGEKYVDVTPDIIEHAILRGNRPHPSQVSAALLAAADAAAGNDPDRDGNYYYNTLTFLPTTHAVVTAKLPLPREDFDARIHFILNCGAMSCPPIKVLRASARAADGTRQAGDRGNVEQALLGATAAYMAAEVRVDAGSQTVYLPRLLMWYEKDFGSDLHSVLARVVHWLPDTATAKDSLRDLLQSQVAFAASTESTGESTWKLAYNPYDWSLNGV